MSIAVFGLGYVGLTLAVCLAKEEFVVVGVDCSEYKVQETQAGRSTIEEPGLADLLADAVARGQLQCTTDALDAICNCDMAIVCVGTPGGPDGAHDLCAISKVSQQIANAIRQRRPTPITIVYRSTFCPGTMDDLIRPIFVAELGDEMQRIELVYNPEFLREAMAIEDFFNPPKIVIGTSDGSASKSMNKLHRNRQARIFYTTYREAEITKFVDNAFHALKVAFANEIGRICLLLDISVQKIHEIFIADTKLNISPNYLRPGGAFGGPCLPKDVRALQYISAQAGAETGVINALLVSNDLHKQFLYDHVVRHLPAGGSVLLLGLTFKQFSDDLRDSPKLEMAQKLLSAGYQLSIYEPNLTPCRLIGDNSRHFGVEFPSLRQLLVTEDIIARREFDVAVDMGAGAQSLAIRADRFLDLETLA